MRREVLLPVVAVSVALAFVLGRGTASSAQGSGYEFKTDGSLKKCAVPTSWGSFKGGSAGFGGVALFYEVQAATRTEKKGTVYVMDMGQCRMAAVIRPED